ncbi:nicotinamide-nucleotide amidohydrolase family protein [Candidatus Berkiella aquae]|uniref:CinA family protein n=1 Tax=Candidatus Berkiella aquae TaxID=295108 RepID=A0A0Q9YVZ5_9GAMM|nr:CinA family protein [Candidatus Berkiella aquae]MCS5709976.1 CinA family protein [Candidatus Berkiella aquae]
MAIEHLARKLGSRLKEKEYKLVTAESCTGGGIAFAITQIEGCSDWFERGFVTYSNESKQELLGIEANLLTLHGAVSEAVALAMAQGALMHSHADVSISVTGVAGPGGGTPEKPVGTIWLGLAGPSFTTQAIPLSLQGNRQQIREQTIFLALEKCLALLK